MRWDRFFDDLEGQIASEWEAERAALETEAERLRLSRVSLRERLSMLTERVDDGPPPAFEIVDGTVLTAEVTGVGADWVALQSGRSAAMLRSVRSDHRPSGCRTPTCCAAPALLLPGRRSPIG